MIACFCEVESSRFSKEWFRVDTRKVPNFPQKYSRNSFVMPSFLGLLLFFIERSTSQNSFMVNLPSQNCVSESVGHGMLIEFKYSKHSASVFTDRLLYKLE